MKPPAIALVLVLAACAPAKPVPDGSRPARAGWVALFDGRDLANFNVVGTANWRVQDRLAVADRGDGYLVTRNAYADFEMRVELYAEADTNSGVLIRCQDPRDINPVRCYEVNVWDARPEPEFGTGAIVGIARVSPMPRAGGRWSTLQITAQGDRLRVVLNGTETVDVRDGKLARGFIALQHGRGVAGDASPVKFRRVEIRAL